MHCANNHVWWRFLGDGSEPFGDDVTCPVDGTEAVTAARRPLADRVRIELVPATWEIGGTTGFRDQHFLEISPRNRRGQVLRSNDVFTWEETIKRAGWFRNLSWAQASDRWTRTGLDRSHGEHDPSSTGKTSSN
jgi:hypothetical protein